LNDSFALQTRSDVIFDQHQKHSPFYFKCHPASEPLTSNKEIFLKVWKVEETQSRWVEAEVRHHREAFEAGVPVAAPYLPRIERSKSSDGSEYLVFAVDYLHQDSIGDLWVFLEYCAALIDTIKKLHHQAGLLHCDLKPDNVLWSDGLVKLIDFGHAQSISEARSTPGTRGFEAPEILKKKMANSMQTDAFSVGQIILSGLERFEDQSWEEGSQQREICNVLGQIAENLTDADPESRWFLTKAANVLQECDSKLKTTPKGA
jgi:serine/threonine protein kinase